MKKTKKQVFQSLICLAFILSLFACTHMQSNIPTNGENVKEKTNEKYVVRKYERKNDGTYATDNYNYKYRLVLTGRTRNAEKDTTFVYLSNIKNLTFDKAWKARGLSSDMSDYFNEADAVLVEMW